MSCPYCGSGATTWDSTLLRCVCEACLRPLTLLQDADTATEEKRVIAHHEEGGS